MYRTKASAPLLFRFFLLVDENFDLLVHAVDFVHPAVSLDVLCLSVEIACLSKNVRRQRASLMRLWRRA